MVARTPPKLQHKKMVVPPLNPILLRETLDKVDRCMARLQELQYTVAGGNKVISGVTLSPRSTRGYLRTSLRCKQESLRIKNATCRKSSPGKMPTNTGEWRRMSLPAMLLGETVAEIKQASQFAREIVEALGSKGNNKPALGNPTTPMSQRQNQRPSPEHSELRSRRKREKQVIMQTMRLESDTPSKQRAKSRINFKVSPLQCEKENSKYIANRVSPRNRPWVKKTVLFPNPLFHSSSPTSQFPKTNSPGIARNRQTPHKFIVKSPSKASTSLSTKFSMKSPPKVSKLQRKIRSPQKLSESPTKFTAPKAAKFQVKIRSPSLCVSPTRTISLSKRSPKMSTAAKLRWSFSPSRLANRIASSPSKMRSFSPSRLVNRLASPLKSKRSVQKIEGMKKMMSGLKQRPQASTTSRQFVVRGI